MGGDGGSGGATLEDGAPCDAASQCASGECVDGVCCDVACDGLCASCLGDQTGGEDGTCAPIEKDLDPADECASEACALGTCDGAGACQLAATDVVCRPGAGDCDLAESCDGVSATCPADQVVPGETVCRVDAGACDVEETCDGVSPECPSNAVEPALTVCGAYVCDGASDLCPTTCANDLGCSTDNVCLGGTCVPGRRAFVTSVTTTGALGGLDGGDAFCQGLASAANFRGQFRMWLSDATGSPSTRFNQSTVPYYRADGVMLAASYADVVDGTLLVPLNILDTGAPDTGSVPFTGTAPNGTALITIGATQDNCSGWTSASSTQHGWCGNSAGADGTWTQSSNVGAPRQCNVNHRFYCFGQE